jgi:hypothetical protein
MITGMRPLIFEQYLSGLRFDYEKNQFIDRAVWTINDAGTKKCGRPG